MLTTPWPPSTLLVGVAALVAFVLFVVFYTRRSASGLATSGIGTSPIARRSRLFTGLSRLVIAALLLGLLVSGFWQSRQREVATHKSVSCRSSGVIVVDLSGSTGSVDLLKRMGKALDTLTGNPKTRIGLVLFSDDAYEMFPPCTKPQAFRRIVELFLRPTVRVDNYVSGLYSFPVTKIKNPWTDSFVGGTAISTGLKAGLRAYLRDPHVAGAPVVLISDLANGEASGVLEGVLDRYNNLRIPFRIFGLSPSPESKRAYTEHLDDLSFRIDRKTFREVPPSSPRVSGTAPRSWTPLAIAVILLVLLAVSERRSQLYLQPTTTSRKEEKR